MVGVSQNHRFDIIEIYHARDQNIKKKSIKNEDNIALYASRIELIEN
jgi:hypothetical protein